MCVCVGERGVGERVCVVERACATVLACKKTRNKITGITANMNISLH